MTFIEKLQQDAAKFKARFEADPKYKERLEALKAQLRAEAESKQGE